MTLKQKAVPYILLLPSFALVTTMLMYPMLFNFSLSLFDWSFVKPQSRSYLGLGNYVKILTSDHLFWNAVRVTFIFVTGTLAVEFCLGMIAAILLNEVTVGRRVLTACLILPYMVARIATALTWKLMWSWDFGLINYFLDVLGFEPVTWLANPSTALIAVMVSEIWRSSPFAILILLAGLSAIPNELYEAARVDGAGAWRTFRHITLPLLMPSIGVALMFQTIFKLRVFDLVFMLTQGGPQNATMPLGILIYNTYFKYYEGGYSAALACIMLIMGVIVSVFYIKVVFQKQTS